MVVVLEVVGNPEARQRTLAGPQDREVVLQALRHCLPRWRAVEMDAELRQSGARIPRETIREPAGAAKPE
jgi:hypothetical protein